MGRVENGEEGDLPPREREREREEWLVFLSLTLYIVFFDAFFFTHKVIIMCVWDRNDFASTSHNALSLSLWVYTSKTRVARDWKGRDAQVLLVHFLWLGRNYCCIKIRYMFVCWAWLRLLPNVNHIQPQPLYCQLTAKQYLLVKQIIVSFPYKHDMYQEDIFFFFPAQTLYFA